MKVLSAAAAAAGFFTLSAAAAAAAVLHPFSTCHSLDQRSVVSY